MIILWIGTSPCVWAYVGEHDKMDLAKALIERNKEHEALNLPIYDRATNSSGDEVIYSELLGRIKEITNE